ncbi:MAG: hypothetical protein ABWZ26_00095 [Candidatus Nanopelagicales bacterium]
MRVSAAQQRRAERVTHLAMGLLLVGYVYLPVSNFGRNVVRYVALPVLVASGLVMWQAARIRRWRRARAADRSVETLAP